MTARTKSVLKYICALLLLGFIVRHAGMEKILGYLRQISPLNLFLALIFVTFAQLIAALRMQFFFRVSGFPLNTRYAIILYYVGAFYNFLLPGGIGGDAYKVILARRRMEMPAMQGIRIMVADRASGLCIIMLIMFLALYQIDFSRTIPYAGVWLMLASVVTLIAYVIFSEWFLKQKPVAMLGSLVYSLGSQFFWVVTLLAIWKSIGGGQHAIEYIIFYSAACITGMLPISVGGLGIKEMTYFYGAEWMQRFAGLAVNADVGVAISLCIFAITFICALPGLLLLEKVVKTEHSV